MSLVPEQPPRSEPRPTARAVRASAHDRRRTVLTALRERDGPTTLAALVSLVADRTTGSVEGIRIDLHHVDLPKLDDAGLVAYDPEEHVVEPGDALTATDGPGWDGPATADPFDAFPTSDS